MSADDWHLPGNYWVECKLNGSVVLFWNDLRIWDFPPSTARRAIEAWCHAYETGRQAGLKNGIACGRSELATELRRLLQLA